ncbi:MAG: STAS domain-containing protein [Gallionellaceae bacterium]|jgi:phospholipid transport system transporter-binding protein
MNSLIAQHDNVVQISGALIIANAAKAFCEQLNFGKNKGGELVADFAGVEGVDSSAVSLMLCWMRAAQRNNVKLSFINVPVNLVSLANLYGVAETLMLRTEAAIN